MAPLKLLQVLDECSTNFFYPVYANYAVKKASKDFTLQRVFLKTETVIPDA
jgi:hypothetical protein